MVHRVHNTLMVKSVYYIREVKRKTVILVFCYTSAAGAAQVCLANTNIDQRYSILLLGEHSNQSKPDFSIYFELTTFSI